MKKIIVLLYVASMSTSCISQKIDTTEVLMRLTRQYIYSTRLTDTLPAIKKAISESFDSSFFHTVKEWQTRNNIALNKDFVRKLSSKYYAFKMFLLLSCNDGKFKTCSVGTVGIAERSLIEYLDQYSANQPKIQLIENIWIDKIGRTAGVNALAYYNKDRPENAMDKRASWDKVLAQRIPTAYATVVILANVDTFSVRCKCSEGFIGYTLYKQISIQVPLKKEYIYIIDKEGFVSCILPPVKFDQVEPPKNLQGNSHTEIEVGIKDTDADSNG